MTIEKDEGVSQCCETPLVEKLRSVPETERIIWTESDGLKATHFVPAGRLMHKAADELSALQSRCEGLERALDIARIEQERFAAQSNKFAEILGGILHIIPPDFVTPDGKIMQFVPPDPLAYLRALANSISKAYAALSPSGKAGEGASPTSEGGGSV